MCRALERAHPGVQLDDSYVSAVLLTLRDHVQLLPQLVSSSTYFFTQPSLTPLTSPILSSHGLTPASASNLLSATLQSLPPQLEAASLTAALKRIAEEQRVVSRTLFWLLRFAMTMEEKGPSLSELIATMGSERVAERLTAAKEAIDGLQSGAADGSVTRGDAVKKGVRTLATSV